MTVLRSIAMAFSLFSRIPMPHIQWKPESMRYLMAAFPLVGVVVGALVAAWVALCTALGANAILTGAGITVIPLIVTGGIHLDGFCDVVDAQSSHAELARKREIMKDPHIGAFAAIGVGCYLIAYYAFATQIAAALAPSPAPDIARIMVLVGLAHVLTRAGSGIATVAFPKASSTGMLSMEHDSANAKPALAVLVLVTVAALGGALACQPIVGCAFALVWALSLGCLRPFANRAFGGMSGDVAGFYLQSTELALIATLALVLLAA